MRQTKEEKEMKNSEYTFDLTVFGITSKYVPQCEEEKEKAEKFGEMIKIQLEHGRGSIEGVLMRTCISGLGEKVADEFDKAVQKEKRKSLLGLGASAFLFLWADYYDLGKIG